MNHHFISFDESRMVEQLLARAGLVVVIGPTWVCGGGAVELPDGRIAALRLRTDVPEAAPAQLERSAQWKRERKGRGR